MPEDRPPVIDPTTVSPADRCITCFQPITRTFSYCENCGTTRAFGFDDLSPGQRCINHPTVAATAICSSCNKPVCDDCTGKRGKDLFGGFDWAECKNCLARIDELQKSFRKRLEEKKVCAKHPNQMASFRCVKCKLPHCEACLYFTRKLFRTRLAKGPFCLKCFRWETLGRNSGARKTWISAREAIATGLLRGVDPNALA
jgi:B-box zinc finger